jgi:signal transduction histidine kinase
MTPSKQLLDEGTLAFSIESRLLRELGERLVKQPEVAIVELIKNAYDADATSCAIQHDPGSSITITDDGVGMTLAEFSSGWMRVGTSSKEAYRVSRVYRRRITGEKGIGRFAVRFLGSLLELNSVADDPARGYRTTLTATFDWTSFDEHEDLGSIRVPYALRRAATDLPTGTTLLIRRLRSQAATLDLHRVRTDTLGMLSPLRSLLRPPTAPGSRETQVSDPGFVLTIESGQDLSTGDVGEALLRFFVLRVVVLAEGKKLKITVYQQGHSKPYLSIVDTYENRVGSIHADIRFFPRRPGVFAGAPVDGRRAYTWVKANSGVAVFDRDFRVQPYGTEFDDWLQLQADAARNRRHPRSAFARKHFGMTDAEVADPATNWMLRLPESAQLIGVVQVESRRGDADAADDEKGLVPAADREGFVANEAFRELQSIIRGAVETIAVCDRRIQLAELEARQAAAMAALRRETQEAVRAIESNPHIRTPEKARLVQSLQRAQAHAEAEEEHSRERVRQLEVMSMLGVVAGFMTHEFGTALQDLREARAELQGLPVRQFGKAADALGQHISNLEEFVKYSQGYVKASRSLPPDPYPARPRLRQMVRIFGQYATDRQIDIEISVDPDLLAPLVPVALYNGIALNLYSNALKALTARSGSAPKRIAFRAWNDNQWHHLEVSDTGIGIPPALRERVFEPLFTTTENGRDPLGSGMGLGLALVRRGVEAFGGHVDIVEPPPEYATCVRVRLPLQSRRQ